jgi:ribosomal protein L7Ae-like RNA K-turn-binding protein
VVTRESLPKERMIRFVLGPDRQIVPDLAAKLPGRGMWLSASWDVVESVGPVGRDKANQRGNGRPEDGGSGFNPSDSRAGMASDKALLRAFSRAARTAVTLPPDLLGLVRAGLEQRIAASLGLARRAGQAVAGFEKARDLFKLGRASLLVQAQDGSPSERARFLSGLGSGRGATLTVIDPLPGASLGRVFGRDYVVHVAIGRGKLADALIMDAGRLKGLTKRPNETTERGFAPVNEVAGTDE